MTIGQTDNMADIRASGAVYTNQTQIIQVPLVEDVSLTDKYA